MKIERDRQACSERSVLLPARLREHPLGAKAAVFLLLSMALAALWGCNVSAVPQLGAISVTTDPATTPPTALSSVIVGTPAFVSVAVGQDQENLGVNWTVTCLGSPKVVPPNQPNPDPNPCGTISPVYVGSNVNMTYTAPTYIPVGNTVTITAFATSDPAVSSSITLTIAPEAITIALNTNSLPPMAASGSASIAATVSNDPAAAGVSWTISCGTGNTNCGSLNSGIAATPTETASSSRITYTAPASAVVPAGGTTVTITAASITDPTKTASATVTVEPISLSMAVSPATTVPEGATATLTTTVAYDFFKAGVTWTVTCSSSITSCPPVSGTPITTTLSSTSYSVAISYTVLPAMPVGATLTFVATSQTDPTKSATATVTVGQPPPIAVTVTLPDASVQLAGTLNGPASPIATVLSDLNTAGVTWTLACGSSTAGACGTIASSGSLNGNQSSYTVAATYTAPATMPPTNPVTVTAASITASAPTYLYPNDPNKSATATITLVPNISIAFSPALPAPITAGTGASFSAKVTNDIASAGVTWSATCSNNTTPCGSFTTPSQAVNGATTTSTTTYTAPLAMPAGSSVTVTAASTASSTAPPTVSTKSTVSVTPVIQTSFVPFAPSQMPVSNLAETAPVVNLTAGVANDTTSAGVDWSCAGGQFMVTPAIAATATTSAVAAVYAPTLHTASGQAAGYIPPSQVPSGNTVTITAKAHNPAATSSLATATAVVTIVNNSNPPGVQLQGAVLAGAQPVAGASVSLYAAGAAGYYSATTQPLSPVIIAPSSAAPTAVTTGSNGSFTIPAGYSCPSQTSQLYLVATGGNAGAGVNSQLAMMTALGPCGSLNSGVSLVINEVTTVASVWALEPFMPSGGALSSGAYQFVNSSSSNATAGLANAFAAVNNLVNITTGQALSTTPAGNGTAPQSEIDSLAGILNTCTATKGGAVGDGSACSALFSATTPATTLTAPTDTVQAALNIAQHPNNGLTGGYASALFKLLPTKPPITPVLSASPNDWTLALSFTGGGLEGTGVASPFPVGFAIDASGNLWIANNSSNSSNGLGSVTTLNNMGAALSPPATGKTLNVLGGYKGGGPNDMNYPNAIAIDPLGNAWVADSNNNLTEFSSISPYTVAGELLSGSNGFTGGGLQSEVLGIAADGSGNVWAVSSSGVFGASGVLSEFAGANTTVNQVPQANGTPLSSSNGYTTGIGNPSGAIAVDNSGTVWMLNSNGLNSSAAEYNSSGAFVQTDYGYTSIGPPLGSSVLFNGVGGSMAIDSGGNVWTVPSSATNEVVELLAGGSQTTDGGLGAILSSNSGASFSTIAVDGAGHLWSIITASGFCSVASLLEMSSSGAYLDNNSNDCGYVASNIGSGVIAIDGSGNLWVLGAPKTTEFIGVATPVVTPFSLGVKNKTLAKKP